MADELDDWLARLDRVPAGQQVVPTALVDRARSTIADHVAELRRPGAHRELLHYDLHYLNVLHTSQTRPMMPAAVGGRSTRCRWPAAGSGS